MSVPAPGLRRWTASAALEGPGEIEVGTRPSWLSTTGASTEQLVENQGVVVLERASRSDNDVPNKTQLGAGWPAAITLGRSPRCEIVVPMKAASKVHCQFALRSFRLQGGMAHEALFLRDVSKNKTLVNGRPAVRPWHWLHDGDTVGLSCPADPAVPMDLLRVQYCNLIKLPGHELLAREPKREGFGEEVCGEVVEITYTDSGEAETYRMRIISFNKKLGWHMVDSKGLSKWDGDDFTDEVDLNSMHAAGQVVFVDERERAERRPKKRTKK